MTPEATPKWADLMSQARSMLPSLDPRWTDHNPTDPGMVVVELAAWLTEMLLYRLEEIPPESAAVFLALMTGQRPPEGLDVDAAMAEALRELRTERRAVTGADHLALIHRGWPQVAGGLGPLARVEIHPGCDLEAGGAPRPGSQSVLLMPAARQERVELPADTRSLRWSVPLREPGAAALWPERASAAPVRVSVHSPLGVEVVSAELPEELPCLSFSEGGVGAAAPGLVWPAGGALTVEVWVYLTRVGEGAVFEVGAGAAGGRLRLAGPGAAGKLTFSWGGEAPSTLAVSVTPWVERWCHLAVVAGPAGASISIDGLEVARSSSPWSGSPVDLTGLTLGKGIRCRMAELRLWRTPRAAEELAAWRGRRIAGAEVGLWATWPLDEGAGTSLRGVGPSAVAGQIGSGGWSAAPLTLVRPLRWEVQAADLASGARWRICVEGRAQATARGVLALEAPGRTLSPSYCLPAPALIPQMARWVRFGQGAVVSLEGGGHLSASAVPGGRLTADLTLELWVRPSRLGVACNLVGMARSGELDLVLEDSGVLSLGWGTAGNDGSTGAVRVSSRLGLRAGVWQHVAVVRRAGASPGVWFYIDGALAGGGVTSPAEGSVSGLPLKIGSGWRGSFSGEVADLRVWSVARSAQAIAAARSLSLRQAEEGLVASWPLCEGEGDQAVDRAGGGLRALLSQARWSALDLKGDALPGSAPGAAGSPHLCGGLLTLDRDAEGAVAARVFAGEGRRTLGVSLGLTQSSYRVVAVDSSPLSFAHALAGGDTSPRVGWELGVMHLPSSPDRLVVELEHLPDVDATARARVKGELLEPHRLLTCRHQVVAPRWVPVSIQACVYLTSDADPVEVRLRCERALRERFHPLRGGEGAGWPLGLGLYLSDVYAAIEGVAGVDFVVGGPWPSSGGAPDPAATFTLHTSDAEGRWDREDGQIVGFRVGAHELIQLRSVTLTTARRQGETWRPTE